MNPIFFARVSRLAATAVLAFMTLLPAFPAHAEHYALAIGVADYPGTVNDLRFADNDALDMLLALVRRPNWRFDRLDFLFNSSATYAAIQSRIGEIGRNMDADDTFVFFFSGHGVNGFDMYPFDELDGRDEYLCAYDRDIRDDELSNWLAALPTRNIIFIVDSCFSGGMLKTRNYGGTAKVFSSRAGIVFKGDGFTRDMDDLAGIVSLSASADTEPSHEYPLIRNGLFTFILTALMNTFADPNADGKLTAEELYRGIASIAIFDMVGQHPQMVDRASGELTLCTK